jgi:hypothetical protein
VGLSYHFKLSAPQTETADALEEFLRTVETDAKNLGFAPTMVLKARFDTQERRQFVKRLTKGLFVEDEKLKGVVLPNKGQVWGHDATHGWCRVVPEEGVVLVVADEKQCETVFGFFRYPAILFDSAGNAIASTGTGRAWIFRDFVDSPDPRFRQIVKRFAEAGFVAEEKDEFADGLTKLPVRPPKLL